MVCSPHLPIMNSISSGSYNGGSFIPSTQVGIYESNSVAMYQANMEYNASTNSSTLYQTSSQVEYNTEQETNNLYSPIAETESDYNIIQTKNDPILTYITQNEPQYEIPKITSEVTPIQTYNISLIPLYMPTIITEPISLGHTTNTPIGNHNQMKSNLSKLIQKELDGLNTKTQHQPEVMGQPMSLYH